MHELMDEMERQSRKRSMLHSIDVRLMIIFVIALTLYAVLITDLVKLAILECFILILMAIARLSPGYVLKRLALIFPFGGFLALMQPFIRDGNVIYSWWIVHVTHEGVSFGSMLLLKMTVCVSAVILLSSVRPFHEILAGLKKLKVPGFFIITLNLMVRYLQLFYANLQRIRSAQRSRGFTVRNNPAGSGYVLRTIGNTIGTLFLKSYAQGERVYSAMLARGYSADSTYVFSSEPRIKASDLFILAGLAGLILILENPIIPVSRLII